MILKNIIYFFVSIFFLFFIQAICYSDNRTPTWDGWDFIIANISVEGNEVYVSICNKSPKGCDGDVNVTVNVNNIDYVVAVHCNSGECKDVIVNIPEDALDELFKTILGDPYKIAEKSSGQKIDNQVVNCIVRFSIKGGPLGWHQFYYCERTLTFERKN